jgi:hypothetical protein
LLGIAAELGSELAVTHPAAVWLSFVGIPYLSS